MLRSPIRSLFRAVFASPTGTIPVTNPDLLNGLSWVAGANTTLSIAGGRARATIGAGSNPRIWKQVSGLTNGATYRLNGHIYVGTCSSYFFRISPNSGLPDGSIYTYTNTVDNLLTNEPFVMSGTSMFIGIVGVSASAGQYAEIDDNFSLTAV